MEQLILNTKIEIPLVRKDIVNRERLCDLIDGSSDHKVILVSAAAGFGKTTFLSQWAHKRSQSTAWFSIDENDNDVSCFFNYFIRAIQKRNSSVGTASLNLLQVPQPPQMESVLIILLNEIHQQKGEIKLILDDFHLISSERINQLINFLIDHLPQNMQIIISSRSDPNLPVARWVSQKQVIEIRATDLSFTNEESDFLFNRMLKLDLTPDDIERLKSRTEGWITGLQLASLSLQGQNDRGGYIKKFHGDNRYIIDYLLEEVFEQQSEEIQKFLLYTSFLNRLTGSLCDTLIERHNSTDLLATLERQNMFVFAMDTGREWYRYHQLFKDVLNHRLRQLPGIENELPELNQVAGDWFASQGYTDEAIDHYLVAESYKKAAELMENRAEIRWLCGQQTKLLSWFERLPREYITQHPHLGIFFARELEMNGRGSEAEEVLNQAEANLLKLKEHGVSTAMGLQLNVEELRGRILVIRAVMSSYRGNFTGVILYTGEALQLLNSEDFRWRNIAEITYALANSWAGFGNYSVAKKAFHQAQLSSKQIHDVYLYIFCGICIAAVEYLQGECNKAVETYTGLLTEAEKMGMAYSGIVGSINAALGGIYCERNEIETGLSYLTKGIQLAEQGHDVIMLASTQLNQIRFYFYTNKISHVLKVVDEMETSPKASFYPPWMKHVISAIRPWIWMKTGNMKNALEWVENIGFPDQEAMSMRRETEYVVLARILINQKRSEKAEVLLEYLLNDARKGNRFLRITEIQILKAVNYYYQDDIKKSLHELYAALKFAEPKGLFRIFVFEGEPLAELIEIILSEKKEFEPDPYPDVTTMYVENLLRAFRPETSTHSNARLAEPLSEREQEVLEHIATGMTNNQIADKLYVSLNTIRTHTKKIFSKLDVHSRTQAIAKAKDLGLIQ